MGVEFIVRVKKGPTFHILNLLMEPLGGGPRSICVHRKWTVHTEPETQQ